MARTRPKADNILDWEDLERAPNTLGAFAFLRAPATVVEIGAVKPSDPITVSDGKDQAAKTRRNAPRPYREHRCRLAQDGHSPGEHRLYMALWNSAQQDSSETKIITCGWAKMARKAGMSDKSAKRNLSSLIAKLALECTRDEDCRTSKGRTYRIYSFKTILERREHAGLHYVVRDKGVRFTEKRDPIERSIASDITTPGDITTRGPMDIPSTGPVDITSTPYRKYLGIDLGKTTTTESDAIPRLVRAFSAYAYADEQAARTLFRKCLANCPDVQVEEIEAVIAEKAPALMRDRSIRNPIGLILTAVPMYFEGSALVELRKHRAAEKARREKEEAEKQRAEAETRLWFEREKVRCEESLKSAALSEKERLAAERQLNEITVYLAHQGSEERPS